ncbi:hypothetical protein ACTXGQ_11905 [Marinobacter sp. 1Y8]
MRLTPLLMTLNRGSVCDTLPGQSLEFTDDYNSWSKNVRPNTRQQSVEGRLPCPSPHHRQTTAHRHSRSHFGTNDDLGFVGHTGA